MWDAPVWSKYCPPAGRMPHNWAMLEALLWGRGVIKKHAERLFSSLEGLLCKSQREIYSAFLPVIDTILLLWGLEPVQK